MSIRQGWDEKDRSIILCTIKDNWTWEEYHEAFNQISQMIGKVSYRVDLIMDMSEAGPLPMSAASLHIQSMLEKMPDNFGVAVVLSPDKFTRMVLESLDRVLPMAKDRFFMSDSINGSRRRIYLVRGAQLDDGLDAVTRPVSPKF